MDTAADSKISDLNWHVLYKVGGAAAWAAAVLTLSEQIFLVFFPQPSGITRWIQLFQTNRLIGILDFWGLEIPMYAMFALVYLTLCLVLSKANPAITAIALMFALLGIGIFFATNNPFLMVSLSDQYAAAATDAQRSTLLAAGEAVLANTNQRAVGGFNMGLFLVSMAGLMVSIAMLRSSIFSRTTAVIGIAAHTLALADYLRQALTPSVLIALLVIIPNAILLIIWLCMVGRRLYQLGLQEEKALQKQP